jgi:hypothetical protein
MHQQHSQQAGSMAGGGSYLMIMVLTVVKGMRAARENQMVKPGAQNV